MTFLPLSRPRHHAAATGESLHPRQAKETPREAQSPLREAVPFQRLKSWFARVASNTMDFVVSVLLVWVR